MRILMLAVPVIAFLAGCATPAKQAARAEREMDRMVLVYGPACEKLGFKAATDPWRNCVIGLGQKDAALYYGNAYYGPPYWRRMY